MNRTLALFAAITLVAGAAGCGSLDASSTGSLTGGSDSSSDSAGLDSYSDGESQSPYPSDSSSSEQSDWEAQVGVAWDEFAAAFEDAGYSACEDFFNITNNGSMYADDYEYTSADCQNSFAADAASPTYASIPPDLPDDPTYEGEQAGIQEACEGFFDSEQITELYWGDSDVYTVDDCMGY